jgi:glycosyltransferase involved in cell wall biosynthesis
MEGTAAFKEKNAPAHRQLPASCGGKFRCQDFKVPWLPHRRTLTNMPDIQYMPDERPSKPSKLAFLGSSIPSLSATFIYREIFELERRGYQINVYSLHSEDLNGLSAEALPLYRRTNYLLPVRTSEVLASHWHYCVRCPVRYAGTLWKMVTPHHRSFKDRYRSLMHFGEGMVLAHRMEMEGITHVHSHYASQPTSVARVVHLITGIPYSFSAHAHDIWEDRLLLREKLREVRFAVCCSEHGRSELIKQGDPKHAQKVKVVYHGLDVRRFVPPAGQERRGDLILSVGRLDAMKGFPDLITACHILRERGKVFECRIVGEGEERPHLAELIRQYQLENVVSMPGAVPQEKLMAHYHEASVFALPCVKTRTNRYDGIPNVLVEAMATGLPVVTTSISGIPELVESGKTGFLVASGNPEELADRLGKVLDDAALRHGMSQAARAKVTEHFDNRKTIEPLIELLRAADGLAEPCANSQSK